MSRPQQVFLHVGLPKTGTTYLQRCFAENSGWLAARGVTYPTLGREQLYGHHNLARALDLKPLYDADYGARDPVEVLRGALDVETPQVLISAEELSTLSEAGTARLGQALQGLDVSCVVYLRRRSAVAVSMWCELTKWGRLESFEEFLAGELLGASAWVLRPEVVLRGVHALVGGDAMKVILYDHLVEDGVELSAHFVEHALGLACDGAWTRPDRAFNPSDDRATLEVVRAIHAARTGRGLEVDIRAHAALRAFLARDPESVEVIEQVRALTAARGVDLDLRRLDSEWLEQDQWMRRELGASVLNPADGDRLFRPRERASLRVLRPADLYRALPVGVFERLAERAPARRA